MEWLLLLLPARGKAAALTVYRGSARGGCVTRGPQALSRLRRMHFGTCKETSFGQSTSWDPCCGVIDKSVWILVDANGDW